MMIIILKNALVIQGNNCGIINPLSQFLQVLRSCADSFPFAASNPIAEVSYINHLLHNLHTFFCLRFFRCCLCFTIDIWLHNAVHYWHSSATVNSLGFREPPYQPRRVRRDHFTATTASFYSYNINFLLEEFRLWSTLCGLCSGDRRYRQEYVQRRIFLTITIVPGTPIHSSCPWS